MDPVACPKWTLHSRPHCLRFSHQLSFDGLAGTVLHCNAWENMNMKLAIMLFSTMYPSPDEILASLARGEYSRFR
jgi:hypothetical protein